MTEKLWMITAKTYSSLQLPTFCKKNLEKKLQQYWTSNPSGDTLASWYRPLIGVKYRLTADTAVSGRVSSKVASYATMDVINGGGAHVRDCENTRKQREGIDLGRVEDGH